MMQAKKIVLLLVGVSLVSACGSRTGLRIGSRVDVDVDTNPDVFEMPDAEDVLVATDPIEEPDAVDVPDVEDAVDVADVEDVLDSPDVVDVPDAMDVPDVCIPQVVTLGGGHAEVLFVLDRSGSMRWTLSGEPSTDMPSRWSILTSALQTTLPRYDALIDMGLLTYPSGEAPDRLCSVVSVPTVVPAPSNARNILSMLRAQVPSGYTPTAAALLVAQRHFESAPAGTNVRAVVLATDGAPNCNPTLPGDRCLCTSQPGLRPDPACLTSPQLCLDDTRSTDTIRALARSGINTWVIGIDGESDPVLSATLTAMARAGERPNPVDPMRAYYSVLRPTDLSQAFDRIQSTIVACTLPVTAGMRTSDNITLLLNGRPVMRDTTRSNGWDWANAARDAIILSGETCTVALTTNPLVQARFECVR
jgi:hypothetical protein